MRPPEVGVQPFNRGLLVKEKPLATNHPSVENSGGWLEASGLRHILRTLGLAIQPAKLGIALATLFLTFVLGGTLDWLWTRQGGIDPAAITQYVSAREFDRPYVEPTGSLGVFGVWREHQRRCVLGFLSASLPGASLAAGTPLGAYVELYSQAGPLRNLAAMGYGVLWMMTVHPLYFLLFGAGGLVLWAFGGGAICRLAAVQFARDEKPTMRQALAFAREKLIGGFVLAPCIPLVFILIAVVLLALLGLVLRLPLFGDLLAGLAFGLALLGGFVVAVLLLGFLIGGSLFWPTVAVEGSDAFDSFSRSLSYPMSKPWKALLYAMLSVLYASLCWVFVNLFVFGALSITRAVVGFGTSPFGWWNRGTPESPVRKLDLLWPLGGPNALYAWPDWSRLSWYEYVSAFWIGMYVLLVVGLVWAFLASFYFSGSTVLYFLLRRDVDGTDLEEVLVDDEPGDEPRADIPIPVLSPPN